MPKNICKQILLRENSQDNKISSFHRTGPSAENRYGFMICKHNVKVCFLTKCVGCRQCIKEKTIVENLGKIHDPKPGIRAMSFKNKN